VLMPKRTVLTIRAQLWPALFAKAIHSHRPTPIRPTMTPKAMPTFTAVLISESVRLGRLAIMALWMASLAVRLMTMPMRLNAAPVYISFTAVSTDAGAVGRCGGGGMFAPPGYPG